MRGRRLIDDVGEVGDEVGGPAQAVGLEPRFEEVRPGTVAQQLVDQRVRGLARRAAQSQRDMAKPEVRELARRFGLEVADKQDSQDICFVPTGRYTDIIGRLRPNAMEPGDIVDLSGRVLGRHQGIANFTVGQRKGLGIDAPAPDGRPRYVVEVSPETNTVTVGPAEALEITGLTGIRPRWCGPTPAGSASYTAQLRAHGEQIPVTAELAGDELRVTFTRATRAIAPGQAVVLYAGTRVVGSATIAATTRR